MKFNTDPNCTELIESGKCNADCCRPVPLPERYWQQLKKLVRCKSFKPVKFNFKSQKMILAVTEDKRCVFLDEGKKCIIFKSPMRPPYCSQFGCNATEKELSCPHINEGETNVPRQTDIGNTEYRAEDQTQQGTENINSQT